MVQVAAVNGNNVSTLQAIVVLDTWNKILVFQHAPWLVLTVLCRDPARSWHHYRRLPGRHRSPPESHKAISIDRRPHRDRETRRLAIAHELLATAEIGLKEHDRLALARTLMERKLVGRRASSNLPALIDLVTAKPLVSTGMIANPFTITPRFGSLANTRFRAWGVF